MSRRDKMLLLVLPALALFIGYATYGLSHWRQQLGAAEKGIAATREKIPSPAEDQQRRSKLAAATREAKGETEAMDKLRAQIAASTKSLAAERVEMLEAKKTLGGTGHRDELTKADAAHRAALQSLDAAHQSVLVQIEKLHAAALAKLWATSKDPTTDRTQRIELLNKVLARFDLVILDATDDVKGDIAPPRLQSVMKTAAESDGLAPPKPRQVKVRGRYADVAAALESLARGDAWAVPLGLVMKPVADDSGLFEWTLTVWV